MYLTSSFGLWEESLGMEHASWFPLDMPSLSPVFFPSFDPAYGSTFTENGFREAAAWPRTTSLVLCAFHHTLGGWKWEVGAGVLPALPWHGQHPPRASHCQQKRGCSYSCCVATAKSLQSCPTLCDPIDSSPPGSPAPGILQARTLEWVAISFSKAWKWKVKVKSLSCVQLLATVLFPNGPAPGMGK